MITSVIFRLKPSMANCKGCPSVAKMASQHRPIVLSTEDFANCRGHVGLSGLTYGKEHSCIGELKLRPINFAPARGAEFARSYDYAEPRMWTTKALIWVVAVAINRYHANRALRVSIPCI
jgi:hypothetical protein